MAGRHGRARTTPRFVPSHLRSRGRCGRTCMATPLHSTERNRSVTPKPRYRRTHPDHQPPRTVKASKSEPGGPVVVPVVEFTITANGSMTVTVDGEAYQPEPFAPG